MAHVRATGVVDAGWCPRPTGEVDSIARAGSRLYALGDFKRIGGLRRRGLAALDMQTGRVTAWNPRANWGAVRFDAAIAARRSVVYVGGDFSRIGGRERNGLAALDPRTGRATRWNPHPRWGVNRGTVLRGVSHIAAAPGRVYVDSAAERIGGAPRCALAALDAGTGRALAWNPNRRCKVIHDLVASGGRLYVTGDFATLAARPRRSIAAFSLRNGRLLPWRQRAVSDIVDAVAPSGNTVVAAVAEPHLAVFRLVAIDRTTGRRRQLSFPRPNAEINAIGAAAGEVIVGGYFGTVGGAARRNLMAVDARTGQLKRWNPGADGDVHDFASSGSTLYVGGSFSRIQGEERKSIAAFDTATGRLTGWRGDVDGRVSTLAVSGQTLYVGGAFTRLKGQPRSNLGAIDLRSGELLPWNPDVRGGEYGPDVLAVAPAGPVVYVGGEFAAVGGEARAGIAAIESGSGRPTDWRADADGGVETLVVSGSTLYAGGDFEHVGGTARDMLAAFDVATGKIRSWNPRLGVGTPLGFVGAVAPAGTRVFVGGRFSVESGRVSPMLAAFDVATAKPTAWRPFPDFYGMGVETLLLTPGRLYVGGDVAIYGDSTLLAFRT
ncbi:MAG TPA: hypothetical protein VFM83_01600 [Gaiellaceae bacterium]|nr:hypothetical protein [Gaiellaceae bacterium]